MSSYDLVSTATPSSLSNGAPSFWQLHQTVGSLSPWPHSNGVCAAQCGQRSAVGADQCRPSDRSLTTDRNVREDSY
eukprot:1643096-Pyramimonas_sp.AAC.1